MRHPATRPGVLCAIAMAALPLAARASDGAASALAEAARRLASLPGLRAEIVARDEVLGRSFMARLVYRAPDRLHATIEPGDFVSYAGGTLVVREGARTRRCDAAAWAGEAGSRLAPILREGLGIAGAPAGEAAAIESAAACLAPLFSLDIRRAEDRVSIALLVTHRIALEPFDRGLAFSFRQHDRTPATVISIDEDRIVLRDGAREATISRRTGFFERVILRGPTGRIEGEVVASSCEVLPFVPEEWLAPPEVKEEEVEQVEPAPRSKESFARAALGALFGRLRAAAEADPDFAGREGPRLEAVLTRFYAALFRSAYPEPQLREEARRATRADAEAARAAIARAGAAGRKRAIEDLRVRFRANCETQLRDAASELVRLAEAAIGPEDAASKEPVQAARRALVRLSGRAALAAYRQAIVAPMEEEAAAELERLAAAPAPSGGSP
jgi:hypothetical protein